MPFIGTLPSILPAHASTIRNSLDSLLRMMGAHNGPGTRIEGSAEYVKALGQELVSVAEAFTAACFPVALTDRTMWQEPNPADQWAREFISFGLARDQTEGLLRHWLTRALQPRIPDDPLAYACRGDATTWPRRRVSGTGDLDPSRLLPPPLDGSPDGGNPVFFHQVAGVISSFRDEVVRQLELQRAARGTPPMDPAETAVARVIEEKHQDAEPVLAARERSERLHAFRRELSTRLTALTNTWHSLRAALGQAPTPSQHAEAYADAWVGLVRWMREREERPDEWAVCIEVAPPQDELRTEQEAAVGIWRLALAEDRATLARLFLMHFSSHDLDGRLWSAFNDWLPWRIRDAFYQAMGWYTVGPESDPRARSEQDAPPRQGSTPFADTQAPVRTSKGGRRPIDTPQTAQIIEAWRTGGYTSYKDLARELGTKVGDVKRVVGRENKRQRRKASRPDSETNPADKPA